MNSASLAAIKAELKQQDSRQLAELLLRLAKYKKENKELLSFLLFHQDDVPGYIAEVKEELDAAFSALHTGSLFLAKKTVRKVLRLAGRYIRYAGNREVEIELLLHCCRLIREAPIDLLKSLALEHLYKSQIRKIGMSIAALHEDLQHEYLQQLEEAASV